MGYVIGVDIGGTFTDAFSSSQNGIVSSAKAPSTPPDYSNGFLNALQSLASNLSVSLEKLLAETDYICHGTTTTLNALVTGNTERVGFITTKGHRDSIYIMNVEGRYLGLGTDQIQNFLETSKPEPLVPKRLVMEVAERIDCKGEVVVPLNEEEARRKTEELLSQGVRAIAVSFLWSFLNPIHERRMREIILGSSPNVYVALSSEISPRIREFARSSTTIMTAQVAPILQGYLQSLEGSLREKHFRGPLLIMQGSGGVMSVKQAADNAIASVGSVLSGGVTGAETLGKMLGHTNIICTDMGGTTFLAGLIVEGRPIFTSTTVLRQHPINVPTVYVRAIGSGGGAFAWVDADESLRVGPGSAGATPGPACYGRGGSSPTVTDADLVLGILNENFFLGGRMPIYRDLAARALKEKIGTPLHMTLEEAALGVFEVQNAQTADLVRKTVVEAGYDPRDFVTYAFGGAGPVHCSFYCADLGIGQIVVPLGPTASAFSAFGLASSDVIITAEISDPSNYPVEADKINSVFGRLEDNVREKLENQGIPFQSIQMEREIDIRYSLQIAEVSTPVKGGRLSSSDVSEIPTHFEAIYEKLYGEGTGFREAGFQFITYRMRGRGNLPLKPHLTEIAKAKNGSETDALKGKRPVMLDKNGFRETPIYDYRALQFGHTVSGQAIVEASTTTIVIPEGARAHVDMVGNMIIKYSPDSKR